jgi:hypothetical protein
VRPLPAWRCDTPAARWRSSAGSSMRSEAHLSCQDRSRLGRRNCTWTGRAVEEVDVVEQTTFGWAPDPASGPAPETVGEILHYWRTVRLTPSPGETYMYWQAGCGLTAGEDPFGRLVSPPAVRCVDCERSQEHDRPGKAPLQIDGPGSGGG